MWLKAVLGASAVTLPLLVVLTCWLTCFPRQATQAASSDHCDFACSLNPQELPERRARLAAFRADAREITELDSGYVMRFDLDDQKLLEAASLAAAESHCCGFLDFRITVQPSRGLLAVEVTGPPEAKRFLRENILAKDSSSKAADLPGERVTIPSCSCPAPAAGGVCE
jgi:hypothetical protein